MSAIGDYFRTALLIDDLVYDVSASPESSVPLPDSDPAQGLVEPVSGMVEPIENLPTDDGGTPVSSNSLIQAFLDKGIVCSVLQPTETDDVSSIAINGAKIADLLIFDWYLFDDDERTIRAIRKILVTDPERLKVIVIYTGARSLASVVDRLITECGLNEVSDFILRRDETLVLIFSKPGTSLIGNEIERISEYEDLPGRIRDDLENHFGGLVPELAFSAINVIRESTPRILATFNSSLDAPFLTHRALLPDVSDAGPQFIRLLTSELEISLMESSLTRILSDDSIRKRLNQSSIMKDPLFTELRNLLKRLPPCHQQREIPELVIEVVTLGFEEMWLTDKALSSKQYKRLINQFVKCFGVDEEPNEEPHKSLAVLMSSTQFGDVIPRLEAGIVLENGGKYWLCIQPLCDSVRLTKSQKFPLLPLIINVNKDGSIKSSSAAMVRLANDKAIPVRFSSSIHDLEMPEFDPKGKPFVEAQEQNGAWWFEDTEKTRYLAVCRLRNEFTQQAVQGLTSKVARPGVDSSEWLRRSGQG